MSVQGRRLGFQVNPEPLKAEDYWVRDSSEDRKWFMPGFLEKLLSFRYRGTVPQTDTGSQVENTKALERTRVKELGKMVP